MKDPNSYGKTFGSSKSVGKGNKGVKGKGRFRDIDAGGRTKNAGAGGRSVTHKTGVKPSRTHDGRTPGNHRTNPMNPFKTAARLANSA